MSFREKLPLPRTVPLVGGSEPILSYDRNTDLFSHIKLTKVVRNIVYEGIIWSSQQDNIFFQKHLGKTYKNFKKREKVKCSDTLC